MDEELRSLIKEKIQIQQRLKYNPNDTGLQRELQSINAATENAKVRNLLNIRSQKKTGGFNNLAQAERDFARQRAEKENQEKTDAIAKASEEASKKEPTKVPETKKSEDKHKPEKDEDEDYKEEPKNKKESKWKIFARGSKIAASALGKTAKASYRGAAWAGGKLKAGAENTAEAVGTFNDNLKEIKRPKYELLILMAIIVHYIDFKFYGLEINSGTIVYRAMAYLILGFLTYLFCKPDMEIKPQELFAWALIPVILMPLVYYLMDWVNIGVVTRSNFTGILLLVPIYLIFLMYVKGIRYPMWQGSNPIKNILKLILPSSLARLYFIYLIFAGLSALILMLPTAVAATGIQTPAINFEEASQEGIKLFTEMPGKIWSTFTGIFTEGSKRYKQILNNTLGEYYTGKVEENKERTGVFITEFKATEKYYEGEPITFVPIIVARSFTENINMKFTCVAYNSTNKSINVTGYVDPKETQIYRQDQKAVFCRFNQYDKPETKLSPGRYSIEFHAYFDFETWAYSNYIFMERSFMESIKSNNENINTKFGIPEKTETIYTSGPIMMGFRQRDLPVAVNYGIATTTPLGITIDNKDKRNGEVQSVNEFQIRMPKYFKIPKTQDGNDKCSRKIKEYADDPLVSNYKIYTFQNDNRDLKQSFLTVDCELEISSNDAVALLGGPGGAAQVSVVGTANYSYVLKQEVNIRVEKNPSGTQYQ